MEHLVDASGYCPAHREGGNEHMRALAAKGGKAAQAKLASPGFCEGEVERVTTLEEAKAALANIHVAVLTRRITDKEANAGSKALAEWIKGDTASITKRLTTEFVAVIAEKDEEIEALRKQLSGNARLKAVK